MSEKLYLIITGVFCSIAVIGPCFFGMDAMIGLVLCVIPALLIPALRMGKN